MTESFNGRVFTYEHMRNSKINELELFDNDVINFAPFHSITSHMLDIYMGEDGWTANNKDLSDHFKFFPSVFFFSLRFCALVRCGHPLDATTGSECI